MGSVGRVLFLEGMLMRCGVGGSKTAHIPPYWIILPISLTLYGVGGYAGGSRQAARDDGKGGGAKINILGCSCFNKSGANAKVLLQFIIMKKWLWKRSGKFLVLQNPEFLKSTPKRFKDCAQIWKPSPPKKCSFPQPHLKKISKL